MSGYPVIIIEWNPFNLDMQNRYLISEISRVIMCTRVVFVVRRVTDGVLISGVYFYAFVSCCMHFTNCTLCTLRISSKLHALSSICLTSHALWYILHRYSWF